MRKGPKGPFLNPKMRCTSPIEINGMLAFPCGKCMACRIKRTQEWATRIVHETKYYKSSLFITLTYSNEYLPEGGSLEKDAISAFIKRYRKSIYPRKVKFFACGEYGEKAERPHYHILLLGAEIDDFEPHSIRGKYKHGSWKKGFIDIKPLNYGTAQYVAGYIKGKKNGEFAKEEYGDRLPPYQRQSQGLGLKWAEENKEKIEKNGFIPVKGHKTSIPRYYVKKLGIIVENYDSEIIEKKHQEMLSRMKKQKINESEQDVFLLREKAQREKNTIARIKIKHGGS